VGGDAAVRALYERPEGASVEYWDHEDAALATFRSVLDTIGEPWGDRRLLDVGCGPGTFGGAAADAGWTVTGLELNPLLAERAAADHGFEVVNAPFPDADLAGRRFEVVTMLDVIEHVLDPLAVLAAAHDLLAPRGRVVVFTPNHRGLIVRIAQAMRWATFGVLHQPVTEIFDGPHVTFFDDRTLPDALRRSGFRLDRLEQLPYGPNRSEQAAGLAELGLQAVDRASRHVGGQFRLLAVAEPAGTGRHRPEPAQDPGEGPVSYRIDDDTVTISVGGTRVTVDGGVMLETDDDLTAGTPWSEVGYTVEPFLPAPSYRRLVEGLTDLVVEQIRANGGDPGPAFDLTDYHRVVDDRQHDALAGRLCFTPDRFPIDLDEVVARVGLACGVDVTPICPSPYEPDPDAPPIAFCLRLVRPGSRNDFNPPHRDVWLDRLRSAVNLYVPLAGSDARSSLALIPGSHRWAERELVRTERGAVVGGRSFTVPAVVATEGDFALTRPDPAAGEMLLFSPYLVHGGAVNRNADRTRVSLEMRFWRR